jgi:hypothetical protein
VKQGEGDVVVVFRGPPVDYAVRRKERIAGIWLNTDRVDFQGVPSLCCRQQQAADELMTPEVQAREDIGVAHLKLVPRRTPVRPMPPRLRPPWSGSRRPRAIRRDVANISFENRPLYRGTVHFPPMSRPGTTT